MEWKQLVPPILVPALRKLNPHIRKRCYVTYQEALRDSSGDGYENHDLIDVVIRKTIRYRDELAVPSMATRVSTSCSFSLVALLAAAQSGRPLHVLDFGGAAGAHYFLARALLPASSALRWVVVEAEAMAEAAGRMLAGGELSFSSDLRTAASRLQRVDLIHSSGTLQCVEQPYSCLKSLLAVGARHLLLSRLALTRGDHDVITVHESMLSWNGPGAMPEGITDRKVRYPFVFPQEDEVNRILASAYRRKAEFDDNSGIFPVNNEPIIGLGLLLERLESSSQV
jgi:putative methyltransferase (TIGR04325 family)